MLKKDIAAKAGVSYTTFSAALRGERVALPTAEAIAAVLGRSADKLFDITHENVHFLKRPYRNITP